jgi:hypothetical protein
MLSCTVQYSLVAQNSVNASTEMASRTDCIFLKIDILIEAV